MSNRIWAIAAFAAGAVAGVGGLIWVLTRDRPGAPNGGSESLVAAAEPQVGKAEVTIMEYGPERKSGDFSFRAFRRLTTGAQPHYGVLIPIGAQLLLVENDAKGLLDFWAKYTAFKLPEANARPSMVAWWKARTLDGGNLEISYDVVSGKGRFMFLFDANLMIPGLRDAYNDIEALKKVPISTKPPMESDK